MSVSDRMSCIILRCRWRNIIVLSAHTKREEQSGDSKERFYAELSRFSIIFLHTIWNYCYDILMQCWGGGILANPQGEWTIIIIMLE